MKKALRRQTVDSNTYRFFVPAESIEGEQFTLDDADLAHQVGVVLRLRPDDQVLLLDNTGWSYTVTLTDVQRRSLAGRIEQRTQAPTEAHTALTLYAALIRPERFEWLLQKGTELGVTAFVPLLCERGSRADADTSARKLDRWLRIVREAAEQSRRTRLPELRPALDFAAACAAAAHHDAALLLWEGADVPSLRQTLRDRPTSPGSVGVLSGPEGGLTERECEVAQSCGIIPVTLGPRTLRAETAPLVAAAALLYELGDMESNTIT